MDTWLFNTNQLSTWEQARELVTKLDNLGPVGQGVLPESGDPTKSGIYLPSWIGGPGGFAQPNYTDPVSGAKYFHLHLRFKNGAEGMNVGLILDKFKRYSNSPLYVVGTLIAEANSMGRA